MEGSGFFSYPLSALVRIRWRFGTNILAEGIHTLDFGGRVPDGETCRKFPVVAIKSVLLFSLL